MNDTLGVPAKAAQILHRERVEAVPSSIETWQGHGVLAARKAQPRKEWRCRTTTKQK